MIKLLIDIFIFIVNGMYEMINVSIIRASDMQLTLQILAQDRQHIRCTGSYSTLFSQFFSGYYKISYKSKYKSLYIYCDVLLFLKIITVNECSVRIKQSLFFDKIRGLQYHVLWNFFLIFISSITYLNLLVKLWNIL